MSPILRATGLPALALALVSGVLAVQLSHGGGRFEPLRPADPCTAPAATSLADGIDGLTERLVLTGINDAACTLHVSRESLTLELAQPGERTDAEIDALHDGLQSAVRQLQDEGSLPAASELVDEALATADLNSFLELAIKALPDSVVDAALKTDDVLTRAIDDLDLRTLLTSLDSPDDLNRQVQGAITAAVKDSLLARLRGLL